MLTWQLEHPSINMEVHRLPEAESRLPRCDFRVWCKGTIATREIFCPPPLWASFIFSQAANGPLFAWDDSRNVCAGASPEMSIVAPGRGWSPSASQSMSSPVGSSCKTTLAIHAQYGSLQSSLMGRVDASPGINQVAWNQGLRKETDWGLIQQGLLTSYFIGNSRSLSLH